MKEYYAYSSGIFFVTEKELSELVEINVMQSMKGIALRRFTEMYLTEVTDYRVFRLPKNLKRNNWDSAMIIALYFKDRGLMAKRHNNSQWVEAY
jgi:hypothetical protein